MSALDGLEQFEMPRIGDDAPVPQRVGKRAKLRVALPAAPTRDDLQRAQDAERNRCDALFAEEIARRCSR